jgi:hypothetical protein
MMGFQLEIEARVLRVCMASKEPFCHDHTARSGMDSLAAACHMMLNFPFRGKGDSISPYLPKSDFCIYPHSGIPQELKGLILVEKPLREPWFKILLSGGTPLRIGFVTNFNILSFKTRPHMPSLACIF